MSSIYNIMHCFAKIFETFCYTFTKFLIFIFFIIPYSTVLVNNLYIVINSFVKHLNLPGYYRINSVFPIISLNWFSVVKCFISWSSKILNTLLKLFKISWTLFSYLSIFFSIYCKSRIIQPWIKWQRSLPNAIIIS